MGSIAKSARRACSALALVLPALCVPGCLGDTPPPFTPAKLHIEDLAVLTASPQAGHSMQIRATVRADEDIEDVSIVFVLRSAADDVNGIPADSSNDTVLDACIESYVPASVLSESGEIADHVFTANLIVPAQTKGGTYYVDANIDVLPTSNILEADVEDYDGTADGIIRVGDQLAKTPDLVIDDVMTETELIDLHGGDSAEVHHWVGTVEVTSWGGAPTEDVAISALIEIPGHPLQNLQIWNTHEHVQVWRNDGGGRFKDTRQRLGSSPASAIALGDVDGDGHLDLVAGNGRPGEGGESPNRVWLNDSLGEFRDSGQEIGNEHTAAVALGDLDGDGDLDLVTGNADGAKGEGDVVYRNQEAGMFTEAQRLGRVGESGEEAKEDTYAVALGDLDRDGDLDLVTAGTRNRVWLNDGRGTFTDSGFDFGGVPDRAVLAIGDVDDDGDLDVLLGGPSSPLVLWLNDGSGGFTDSLLDFAGTEATAIALGDLDRDTDLDLVVGRVAGGIEIRRNDGAGGFALTAVSIEDATPGTPVDDEHAYALALGDVNTDGLVDIVAGNDGGDVAEPDMVWINDGIVAGGATTYYRFRPGQRLGGSDTRALALGNIDKGPEPTGESGDGESDDDGLRDLDLDIVSGNLGLPLAITQDGEEGTESGTYEDTLVLSVLRPDSPTRIPIGLRIPPQVEAIMRAATASNGGFLNTKITFCLDPFDDTPEYETSYFDPLRPNDNCIAQEVAVLARPDFGPGDPDVVTITSDRGEAYGGQELGAAIAIHADSTQDRNGSLQRMEKSAPFTARGFTANAYRVRSAGREVRDDPDEARYEQDVEITGITIFSDTKTAKEEDRILDGDAATTAADQTTEVTTGIVLSICAPPLSYAITDQFNEFSDKSKFQRNTDDPNKNKKKSTPGGRVNSPKEILKNGVVGFIPIGPLKLVITVGVCGKLSLLYKLNTEDDDQFKDSRYPKPDPPEILRLETFQFYEGSLALTFFVEIQLQLGFGPVTLAVGVRGEIDLLRGTYATGEQAQWLRTSSNGAPLPDSLARVQSQIIWEVTLTALGGQVSFFVSAKIEINLGLTKFSREWRWSKPFATWEGISIATDGGVYQSESDPNRIIRVE